MSVNHKSFGLTDVGLVRQGNEDCYYTSVNDGLHVVCDGMGGHQAGEVASMSACSLLAAAFRSYRKGLMSDQRLYTGLELPPSGELLVRSIRLANRYIVQRSAEDSSVRGMGTTVVALVLEEDNLSVAHVGDSRAYRIESTGLFPLTRDHSWIAELQKTSDMSEEEAGSIVGKNVITRALGVAETVEVDYRMIKVKAGDRFLLCSDGLCGFATDEEIFGACKGDGNMEDAAKKLVELANSKGGSDNVTVLLVEVSDITPTDLKPLEAVNCGPESSEILAAGDEWLMKIGPALETAAPEDGDSQPSNQAQSKTLIVSIFAAFVIIAALIMFFAGSR